MDWIKQKLGTQRTSSDVKRIDDDESPVALDLLSNGTIIILGVSMFLVVCLVMIIIKLNFMLRTNESV